MEQKILTICILLIPLLVTIGIAIGAILSAWPVTDRLSKRMKGIITMASTLLIFVLLIFLAQWSGVKGGDLVNGSTENPNSMPVS